MDARILLALCGSLALGSSSCPGARSAPARSEPSDAPARRTGAPQAGPAASPPLLHASLAPAPAPDGSLLGRLLDPRPRRQRQWDHIAAAAAADCRDRLGAAGARFRPLPDRPEPDARGCGVPHGVLLTRGPSGIAYSPPLQVDCSLALHLVEIEGVIQARAEEHLGAPIRKIGTLGSYACRGVVGRLAGWGDGLSEHSFGNAVDLARFETRRGKAVSVARSYEPDADEPPTAEARFLRSVARGLRSEASVRVLGPEFDASHRDHLHVDRGTSRWR